MELIYLRRKVEIDECYQEKVLARLIYLRRKVKIDECEEGIKPA